MNQLDELLTPVQASKLSNLSTDMLREHLRKGRIPGRRIAGRWLVAIKDVRAFERGRDGTEK